MPTYRVTQNDTRCGHSPFHQPTLVCEYCATAIGGVSVELDQTSVCAAVAIAFWPEHREALKEHEKGCLGVILADKKLVEHRQPETAAAPMKDSMKRWRHGQRHRQLVGWQVLVGELEA